MKAILGFLLAASLSVSAQAYGDGAATAPAVADGAMTDTTNSIYGLQWIPDEQFERQLMLVHGRIPNPEIGMFGPQSMIWRMTRYITPAALGSGRALILQISHPWVTAGIDEHSITRKDPLKRGRNTFRYLLTMIYGSRDQAMQAARDVRTIHEKIQGQMPYDAGAFTQGSEYRANEVKAMIWVHATLWETLMMTYEQSIGPVSDYDKERYYQETKLFAYMFGIPDEALPASWNEFLAYCEDMRRAGILEATPASKELLGYLFGWHGVVLWLPLKYARLAAAANLPDDLRDAYGLDYGNVSYSFFRSTLWASRVGHKVTPGFLTKNPVHKEAVARISRKKASAWTRFQLWAALGNSRLVNEY